MIRGDTNTIKFKIKEGDEFVDGSTYTEVELQFNVQSYATSVKKLLSKGEIVWNDDHFEANLTQEDTFKLNSGSVEVQVRLFKDGTCKGTLVKSINVGKVLSGDILNA